MPKSRTVTCWRELPIMSKQNPENKKQLTLDLGDGTRPTAMQTPKPMKQENVVAFVDLRTREVRQAAVERVKKSGIFSYGNKHMGDP